MLSYKEYLLEKYITSGKDGDIVSDIYVNPTSKEIKEIGTDSLRFIIDLPNKDIYVFDSNLLHDEAVILLHRTGVLTEFNYTKYWKEGLDSDKYLTMAVEDDSYYSDSISDMIHRQPNDKKKEIIDKVKKVLSADYSWITGKWFDHGKFQKGLDEIRGWLSDKYSQYY